MSRRHNAAQMVSRHGLKVAAIRCIWRIMFMNRTSIWLQPQGLDVSVSDWIKEMFDMPLTPNFGFTRFFFLHEKEASSCFCAFTKAAWNLGFEE